MSAGVAPSGDIYASAPQVQRLEELVCKQQQQIDALLKERNLFQSDFKTFLDVQLQRATSQRGAKAMEAMGTHTFLTTEVTNAVQQIQQTIQHSIQESFPLKKLQMLEQRLMAKPTTSEDIGALVARISQLEARPTFQPTVPTVSNTNQSLASLEEFQQLQRHVTHLEDLLLKEIQKAHRLASTKTGELGAPLQRLQTLVDKLIQDVGHLKSVDGQAVAEALLKTSMKAFKEEIGHLLDTKVSTNELHRLAESVQRMEGFSRDVQVSVLSVSNAQTKLEKDMRELFSEARWSVVSQNIRQEAKKALDEEQARIQNYTAEQHRQAFEQLANTESIVKALDKEVRQHYGPEMLQRHIKEVANTLQTGLTASNLALTNAVDARLAEMDTQIQGHRQHVLEATADIKHQLQASELSKRYSAFQQTLIKHEQTFAAFDKRYGTLQQVLEQQATKAQSLVDSTTEQIGSLEDSLTAMQTTIRTEQTQIRKQLQDWMSARLAALHEQVTRTESSLESMQDVHTRISHELEQSVASWTEQQKKATSEGAELHTKLQESVKQWMSQQETYLYGRVADMSSKVNSLQVTVEEQANQVQTLLSDEHLQQFVAEIERRTKHIQEEWGQRRTQELQLKFGEYEKNLQTHIDGLDTTYDTTVKRLTGAFADWKRENQTTLTHALNTTQQQIQSAAKRCDEDVRASIASIQTLTEDVTKLQEDYTRQTNVAMKTEQYEVFQKSIQKQLESWTTDMNAKLFKANYQVQKEATLQLKALSQKHRELDELFNQRTLDAHIDTVAKQIRAEIAVWQKTSLKTIDSQMSSVHSATTTLVERADILEEQLYSAVSNALSFTQTIQTQAETQLKQFELEQKVRVDDILRDVHAQMRSVKDDYTSVFAKNQTQLKQSVLEQKVRVDDILRDVHAQMRSVKDDYTSVFAKNQTQFEAFLKSIRLDTQTQASQILDQLRTEYTSGVKMLNDIKENATQLQERLVQQINDAVTKEKYKEYQNALEAKINSVLSSSTTSMTATTHDSIQKISSALELIDTQSKSWASMLSEARLRQFVEAIEKRLRAQQDNWMTRRTQEIQDNFETFQTTVKAYKQSTDESLTTLTQTEKALKATSSALERSLKAANDSWMEKQEVQLEAIQKQFMTTLGEHDSAWQVKQGRIDEQVSAWTKQILVFQSQKRQELTEAFKAEQEALMVKFEVAKERYAQEFAKSISETTQKRATLLQEVDGKLKTLLNSWLTTKANELTQSIQEGQKKATDTQVALQTQTEQWLTQRTTDFMKRLQDVQSQIQTQTQTTLSEAVAKSAKSVATIETRLFSQFAEMSQEQSSMLSTLSKRIQDTNTALQQLQTQFESTTTTTNQTKQSYGTLQQQLQEMNQVVQRLRTEVTTTIQDQLQTVSAQSLHVDDTATKAELATVKAALKMMDETIRTLMASTSESSKALTTAIQKADRAANDQKNTDTMFKSMHTQLSALKTELATLSTTQGSTKVDVTVQDRILERVNVLLGRQKNEFSTQLEERVKSFTEALKTIQISSSDKTTEFFKTYVQAHTSDILKQVMQRINDTQTALEKQIPTETQLDEYHSKKIETYQTLVQTQNTHILHTLETLQKSLRSEVQVSIQTADTARERFWTELQTRLRDRTDVWFSEKSELLTNALQKYNQQVQALQQIVLQSKDEWVTQKQKEFVVRLSDTIKQVQTRVATYLDTEQTKTQTWVQQVEQKLVKKQDDTVTLLTNTITQQVQPIQEQLRKVATLTDKQQQDMVQLVSLVRDLQTDAAARISDSAVQDAQRILQSLESTQLLPLPLPPTNLFEVSQSAPMFQATQSKNTLVQGLTKCFYTALFGAPGKQTDTLSQVQKMDGWDYLCFTNLQIPATTGWTIVQVPYSGSTPAVEAKRIKWLSHKVLGDYDVCVWVDAYLAPTQQSAPVWARWIQTMRDSNIRICHRTHAERKCIWQECDAVVKSKRDTEANVAKVRQVLHAAKMPEGWGLFDTNVMIRFHKDKALQAVSEAIFKQVSTISTRDQLAVTVQYYTMGFNAYQTQPLGNVVNRTGNHIRIAV
jgi:hypothetical protein